MATQAAPAGRERAEAPAWFARAIGRVPTCDDVVVEGCGIRLRVWGEGHDRPLVLVHGGAAHSGWWDHIAPHLAVDRRVVALDLSGHGDSEWRETYTPETWAREVGAAVRYATRTEATPIVIAHSMGGRAATIFAAAEPPAVGGLVMIDSPLDDRFLDEETLARRRRPTRVYASRAEAMARWTTWPPQEESVPWVEEYVASQSIRPVDEGWTWKFDPASFGRLATVGNAPERVRCPFVLLRSERGIISADRLASTQQALAGRLSIVELPQAGHHPMLDQPLMLIGVLRALLAVESARAGRPAPTR